MTTIDLKQTSAAYHSAARTVSRRVIICAGTGCVANGAMKVHARFVEAIAKAGIPVTTELKVEDTTPGKTLVSSSGCQGFCQMGPLVTLMPDNILYTRVTPADVDKIVASTLVNQQLVERLLYKDPASRKTYRGTDDIPFYTRQSRATLKDCGSLDPEDLHEYVAQGGYAMANKAYAVLSAKALCDEILLSGLRGRGGGGFPTGRKWELTRIQPEPKKYVICNGDEGDPGAFMDRSVMEGNPHSVIEGMMITARAIGADEGYIYVRAEYPLAVKRMRKAIADATQAGLLGDNLFGTGQTLRLHVMEGAGAFVCGEETALMTSIEGKRGMPSPKPPFPAQSGLWGKPTVINNVETLATIPLILATGAAEYRKRGTQNSPGTKTFALTGHVANTGLIEVPFGSTLREIIFNIGGGVTRLDGTTDPQGFKAVQIGGPSGGCLTRDHLDLPMDFDSLKGVGAMIGSGGLVVMNQKTCMVRIARFFMQFTQNESCGKCVLCREGTRQMLSMLDDITEGRADAGTLELLEKLANAVQKGSLCGLGKTAPSPVLSTLRHFRAEYEAHVHDKTCPAGECKALARPEIIPALCKGCTACVKKCPVNAITGERKQPHTINTTLCIKCGVCAQTCKFNAITGV
jgi:NADH-quinone oxidoreductase subunit F